MPKNRGGGVNLGGKEGGFVGKAFSMAKFISLFAGDNYEIPAGFSKMETLHPSYFPTTQRIPKK